MATTVVALVLVFALLYVAIAQSNHTVSSVPTGTAVPQPSNTPPPSQNTIAPSAYVTEITTGNETYTATVTPYATPWYGVQYLGSLPSCTLIYVTSSYSAPCFSSSNPYVFDCAAAAATPGGCTKQITITGAANENFTVTIWYPFNYTGEQSRPNCRWAQVLPTPPGPQIAGAYCIPVSSTSFLVTEAEPGPV